MIIEAPRLNYREIDMIVRDLGNDKVPFNLSGEVDILFTVKERLTDGDELIRIQKDLAGGGIELIDAENGEITVIITPGDTSLPATDYYYDLFIIKDGRAYSSKPALFRITDTVLGALP